MDAYMLLCVYLLRVQGKMIFTRTWVELQAAQVRPEVR